MGQSTIKLWTLWWKPKRYSITLPLLSTDPSFRAPQCVRKKMMSRCVQGVGVSQKEPYTLQFDLQPHPMVSNLRSVEVHDNHPGFLVVFRIYRGCYIHVLNPTSTAALWTGRIELWSHGPAVNRVTHIDKGSSWSGSVELSHLIHR